MNHDPLEDQLHTAADAARPPRSVVDDVMSRLDTGPAPAWTANPNRARPSAWRRYLPFGITAAAILLIAVTIPFLSAGASITLADVKAALADKTWIHIRSDGGPAAEQWINPATGIIFVKGFDGDVSYINEATNRRLWYFKKSAIISEDTPTIYPKDQSPPPFKPQTIWEYLGATYEAPASNENVEKHPDPINSRPATRFDIYGPDALGHRMLFRQMWIDNATRLPIRQRTRLQLGERPESGGREWAVGTYDFPATGPDSLYAIGVPKNTPIQTLASRQISPEIQKILDTVSAAYHAFPSNYRCIIWDNQQSAYRDITVELIYHQGIMIRQSRYFDIPTESGGIHPHIPKPITPDHILQWADSQSPVESDLFLGDLQYSRTAPEVRQTTRPVVHVMFVRGFSLLAGERPEDMLWPLGRYKFTGPFELLPNSDQSPPGCIGIRHGGDSNRRTDYYLDPAHSYVTVKQITWEKIDGTWEQYDQYLNADFRMIGSSWILSHRSWTVFGGVRRGQSPQHESWNIDLTLMNDADYPSGTFSGDMLLKGAKVEPY